MITKDDKELIMQMLRTLPVGVVYGASDVEYAIIKAMDRQAKEMAANETNNE